MTYQPPTATSPTTIASRTNPINCATSPGTLTPKGAVPVGSPAPPCVARKSSGGSAMPPTGMIRGVLVAVGVGPVVAVGPDPTVALGTGVNVAVRTGVGVRVRVGMRVAVGGGGGVATGRLSE